MKWTISIEKKKYVFNSAAKNLNMKRSRGKLYEHLISFLSVFFPVEKWREYGNNRGKELFISSATLYYCEGISDDNFINKPSWVRHAMKRNVYH